MIDRPDLKVGVFIVRFRYGKPGPGQGEDKDAAWRNATPHNVKVIP